MIPEKLKEIINALIFEAGYTINVVIIDQRNGLDVTELLAKQWQYIPVVQIVRRADEPIEQ